MKIRATELIDRWDGDPLANLLAVANVRKVTVQYDSGKILTYEWARDEEEAIEQ